MGLGLRTTACLTARATAYRSTIPDNTPRRSVATTRASSFRAASTIPDAEQATIAGGSYAVTRFKGTGAEIGAAWGAFVG